MNSIIESWGGGLIVSCQAPADSPLAVPEVIAALAATAEKNGAVGVRIDSPRNVMAVKQRIKLPVLGIHKVVTDGSEVYITPTFDAVRGIAEAGADVIAIDATRRPRPDGECLKSILERVRAEIDIPLMADVATLDEGVAAAEEFGFDVVSTTLSGYTSDTKHINGPDLDLVEKLSKRLSIPVVCEGRLRSTENVVRAFDCGAFAVVVGGAITGIDELVSQYVAATPNGSRGR
jgi:N-acylglucosamine-6-phosphate 2-epimerase